MKERVSRLQAQVSHLCSSHDQLMSLLQVHEHASIYQQSQHLIRGITQRMASIEERLEEMVGRDSLVRERNRHEVGLEGKLEKVEKQLAVLEQQWRRQSIRRQESSQTGTNWIRGLQSMKDQLRKQMESSRRRINQQLVAFKAQRQQQVLSFGAMTEEQIYQMSSKLRASLFNQEQEHYDKLLHEIQLMNLQLPHPQFQDFFEFTYESIRMKLFTLLNRLRGRKFNEMPEQQQKSIQHQEQMVECQILGLKQHAIDELMVAYANNPDKFEVNQLEKQINQQIGQLDTFHSQLKHSISL